MCMFENKRKNILRICNPSKLNRNKTNTMHQPKYDKYGTVEYMYMNVVLPLC